ncbi:MAG: hypothetical protein HQM10_08115 [Candidatus Riflebacteria bacterium]|nr:hypothetical protein [Candidatus Riflebacteria bacterium]
MFNKKTIRMVAFVVMLGMLSISLTGCIGAAASTVMGAVSSAVGALGSGIGAVGSGLWSGLGSVGSFLGGGLSSMWNVLKSGFGWITGLFKTAAPIIKPVTDVVGGTAGAAINVVDLKDKLSGKDKDPVKQDQNPDSEDGNENASDTSNVGNSENGA